MAKKDVQDPRKRQFLDEVVQGVSGFFRELNRELNAPSAHEQELADIHKELDGLQGKVQAVVEQDKVDHQALVDVVEQLKRQQEEMVARFETLQRSLTPPEISKWKAALNRLKQLILVVAGAETVKALYQTVIQEEVYPQLKEKLQQFVDHLDQALGWSAAPVVPPEPTRAPTPTIESTPSPPSTTTSIPAGGLEPELIFIPAGSFLMGTLEEDIPILMKKFGGDRVWYGGEMPQHQVYVGDFHIAKYPVTNVEYKRFVDANPEQPVPYQWDRDLRSFPRGKADHPTVCVSWRDAVAYCRWLAEVTGKPYRLPSEAEWEKAARGTDGRIYPWGNEWDAKRCNAGEGGKGGTTPVGSYPQGASPYGVLDMAGNVWEWCHSLYIPYPYNAKDGREDAKAEGKRVLRGGAFYGYAGVVRCAVRYWFNPNLGDRFYGFRLVLAPGFL